MIVKHDVKDYGTWKRVYDDFAQKRKQLGVKGASVYQFEDSPNTLIVTHQFKDLNSAKSFAGSEELKSTMAKAGVNGHPEIWFTEDIEHTDF